MNIGIGKLATAAAVAVFLSACGGKEEPAAPAGEAGSAPAAEVAPAEPAAPPVADTAPAAEAAAPTAAATGAEPEAAEDTATAAEGSAAAEKPSGKYAEAIGIFQQAGESGGFFGKSYGYAVFPTIGKAGLGVGGAHGKGRVYVGGRHVGDTKVTQLSIGLQAGAQAYSQIIFFEDKRAFDEFSSGNFEFGANASAVAITASVSAGAGTTGAAAGASGGRHDATTASVGGFHKGMAVFTVAKGGLMYEAAIGGQKFNYTAR
jgi:lipid-binding SYLF domain-containing protein